MRVPSSNDLVAGDVAFFPQGLIHYQQNLDCYPGDIPGCVNPEDPGVVTITTRFFKLPIEAIQVSYCSALNQDCGGRVYSSQHI